MKRVDVLVEGQTEEGFVNRVLSPHFHPQGLLVSPISLTTSTDRQAGRTYRGGVTTYEKVRADLTKLLHRCRPGHVWVSTMLDLYALPSDFPGQATLPAADAHRRVRHLETALTTDVGSPFGFIPYLQLHEFEALLFSDIGQMKGAFVEEEDAPGIKRLVELAATFDSPEEINDGSDTAPSKRIIGALPAYSKRKTTTGVLVAEKIGLPTMRRKCPHFNEWITRLEALAAS